ncbi:Aly2p Ecym_6335 [Eremothecium cymbalariae DBVPG|uniref:Arrestin C-terminal-like domain-containing protein n=1 Tax=Eremothecium cymbalariae (strain CBS 270.75 / DBVPG 7215 / KCTC 17166 / NRRL Y-17582) TaxID=931890 RepID=G8JUD1_ERECY|nr:hypothetical protein Ecym_6335 [Eremothecium cymbalariae DBVPG\
MEEILLEPVYSPVFPLEKNLDIPKDAHPLAHTGSLQVYIQLAEPVIFLQGFNSHQWDERPPGLLRGSLIIRVLKSAKLKSISLSFEGICRTEWPEGIPPKKQDFCEINDIVNHTWPFFQAEDQPVLNNLSFDPDDLVRGSNASQYRPLPTAADNSTTSMLTLNPTLSVDQQQPSYTHLETPKLSPHSQSTRSLSPARFLKKKGSSELPKEMRSRSNGNIFSELLSATLPNGSDSSTCSKSSATGNCLTQATDHFIFHPGDYVYSFEQPIPVSTPESITATFGSVGYFLSVTVERVGAFKPNLRTKLPLRLVRTLSPNSVEDTEPICISRDWEGRLHYDIVIASKDIVLDAFLPIALRVTPLDKVILHRTRVYLTETLEYYCRSKKVHRLEPTKKFLIAEHKAAPVNGLTQASAGLRAKNLGNLLEDEHGDIVNKEFDYQVFIPERLNYQQRLHPDTSYQNIKSSHWLKICLRLSLMVDGTRKHYEISVDTPIHVLHKLCSHANTLLPSYDNQAVPGPDFFDFGTTSANLYHDSNMYFPKEVVESPIISSEMEPLEDRIGLSPRSLTPVQHNKSSQHMLYHKGLSKDDSPPCDVLKSPVLKSNIYQPDQLRAELVSPQAIPLSPISSPTLRALNVGVERRDSDNSFECDTAPPSIDDIRWFSPLPMEPPSYDDVLEEDGITVKSHNIKSSALPLFSITNEDNCEDEDIGAGDAYFFRNGLHPPLHVKNTSLSVGGLQITPNNLGRHSIQNNLPSTVKNTSDSFNDLGGLLRSNDPGSVGHISATSSTMGSRRSSIDGLSAQPLLDSNTQEGEQQVAHDSAFHTAMFSYSRDSIAQYISTSCDESSVDITSFYDRNNAAWHPFQRHIFNLPSLSTYYNSNPGRRNHHTEELQESTVSNTLKDSEEHLRSMEDKNSHKSLSTNSPTIGVFYHDESNRQYNGTVDKDENYNESDDPSWRSALKVKPHSSPDDDIAI